MTRFGLWRPSVTFWRVWALVLVVLPQTLGTRFPDLTYSEPVPGDATPVDATVIGMAYLPPPPLPEQWLEYLTESGLVVLLPAIALVLPSRYARTGTRWAAGVLAALGLADGYLGMSAPESAGGPTTLLFMSPFYLLAAVTLGLSARSARAEPSEPTPN